MHAIVAKNNSVRIHLEFGCAREKATKNGGNSTFHFLLKNSDVLPLISVGDPVSFESNDMAYSGTIAGIENNAKPVIEISIVSQFSLN